MALMGREGEAFMRGFLKTRLGQFETEAKQKTLEEQRAYDERMLQEERDYAQKLILDEREWKKTLMNLENKSDITKAIALNNIEQTKLDAEELEKIEERRKLLEDGYRVPSEAADAIIDMGWGNSDSLLDYFLNDPNVGMVTQYGLNWADPNTLDGAGVPIINYFMPTMDKTSAFNKDTAVSTTKENISSAGNSTIDVLTTDTTAGTTGKPSTILPQPIPEPEEVKAPVAADYNQLLKSVAAVTGGEFDAMGNLKIMDPSKQVEFNAAMFEANAYISGGVTQDTNQAALQAAYITSAINAEALNMQNLYNMAKKANAVLKNEQDQTIELNEANFIEAKFNELAEKTGNPFLKQYYLQQIANSPFGRSKNAQIKINSLISDVLALQLGTNK